MRDEAKRYILKTYDTELIDFTVQSDSFGRIQVAINEIDTSKQHLFPMQILAEPSGESVREWLKSRTIPKNRQFVYQILSMAGLDIADTMGIIDVCKGLSLNDAYWVDDESEKIGFSDINLFENALDEVLSYVAYTGRTSTQKHQIGLSTEWTTNGQYPKAWRKIDGNLYLFKSGSEGFANAGLEPYSEYFAAQAAKKMELKHVFYDLQRWNGKMASVCPLFNTKDVSFVPFWAATDHSRFPTNLAIANEMSETFFEELRSMIVFDALICNPDRHAGNYGFLRDNRTGKIEAMAPLFDHNRSLFAMEMREDFPFFQQKANTQYMPATGLLTFKGECENVMGELQHEQLRKMINFQFENHPVYPVPEERLEALNDYIGRRIEELLKIPTVNEKYLQKTMKKEFAMIERPAPALEMANMYNKVKKKIR